MIDIIIFTLSEDAARAGAVLDALKARGEAGKYRTRFIATHPRESGWRADKARAEACDCVLFCTSEATARQDAAAFRTLAGRVHRAERAIAVELDPGSLPAELTGCSAYPLDGPRANPAWWFRALFGNPHKNLITAAATDKAEGRDPPSPAALRGIALKQFGLRLLGLGTVVGLASSVAGLAGTGPVQQWWHADAGRAFAAAKAKGCPEVRIFARDKRYQGSPWDGEAAKLIATCPAPQRTVMESRTLPLDAAIAAFDMAPVSDEAGARALGKKAAEAKCTDYLQISGGAVARVTIERISQTCGVERGGHVCSTDAKLQCEVTAPRSVPDERM